MMRILGVVAFLLLFGAAAHAQDGEARAVLRVGDVLRIRVWPDPALSGDFPIESTGEIYLPLVGSVRVVGRPLNEVRADLRDRYRRVIENAVITATPLFQVSVIGGVQRPNLYEVNPSQTVFDVVSMAGGFTPRARMDQLRLLRGDSVITLDAEQAIKAGGRVLSVGLESGDRIVVPERPETAPRVQLYWNILQAAALLTTLAIQIF